jgi:hypothetical protein
MKASRFWIPAAALAVAFSFAGPGRSQTTTESDTTVTTAPAAPTVSSKTVTSKTVINPPAAVVVSPPPAVVVNPPPAEHSDADMDDNPAPATEETTKTKTSFGPLGVTHSEEHDKTSNY